MITNTKDEIGLKEWHVSLKSAYKESLDMLTTMAEKATKIYGTEIPLKQIGKRRQQLQNEAAAMNLGGNASASFEQKIIQRAIQASADQTKQQQQQQQQHPQQQQSVATSSAITQATINSLPTQTTNTSGPPACQLLHSNKSQSGTHTHHHSHKHHRRPQHSLHRHRETKDCDRDKQTAIQHGGVGSSRHYHHHHRRKLRTSASSDAHFDSSKSKRDHKMTKEKIEGCSAGISGQDIEAEKKRQPDACVDTKKTIANEVAADTCDDNGAKETTTMKTGHDNAEDKNKENNEQTTQDDELNIKQQKHNIKENIKEEDKQINDNESEKSLLVKQNLNFDNKTNKSVEPTNKQQLEAISSSQSSCSDTSSSSGNQGEDDDNEDEEDRNDNEENVRCKAREASSNDNLNSKLSDNKTSTKDVGDAETLDTTSANLDQNKQQSIKNQDIEMKTNLSGGEELTIIKPTLSLESVSEVVEVLNDPSKRITSDNRERERDLVLQYEKLHISNRTSSSSVED